MEIKIVDFMIFAKGRAERELTRLVNEGWRIVAAGGGGPLASYIVVLQRGDEPRRGVERPVRG